MHGKADVSRALGYWLFPSHNYAFSRPRNSTIRETAGCPFGRSALFTVVFPVSYHVCALEKESAVLYRLSMAPTDSCALCMT
jgi:hypothetical protein